MKKITITLFAIILSLSASFGQTPVVTMTTAYPVGSAISFYLAANANGTIVQVDFGNGVKVGKTIGISETIINGTLTSSQTVKIYGTDIVYLRCNSKQLTALDVTQNPVLKYLDCHSNQLTALDVTQNTALINLDCYSNQLTALDVIQNTALTDLWCYLNQLTSLDVANNNALTHLYCSSNQFTTLDVTKNTALKYLQCYSNKLTTLDVTKNTALISLQCNSNKLTVLDVTNNTSLTGLDCYSNQLTELDVTKNTSLIGLDCHSNQFTALDITKNTTLDNLDCSSNQLTALDATKNTVLKYLDCHSNKLTALDVTQNTELIQFECSSNQLTALDVTKNITLDYLGCDLNQLTALDITKNTVLQLLFCNSNQLTALDVNKNTVLTGFWCFSNKLTFETLPLKNASWIDGFGYAPQKPISIEKNSYTGIEIDLSTQYSINGNTTSYTWKTQTGSTLFEGTDFTITNGKTTFLKQQTDSVSCEMINATFPDLSGTNVLKTTFTKVSLSTTIKDQEDPKIKIYSYNQNLYIDLQYDAHVFIFDFNGKLIISKPVYCGINCLQIPNIGFYLVKISGGIKDITQKVVVE